MQDTDGAQLGSKNFAELITAGTDEILKDEISCILLAFSIFLGERLISSSINLSKLEKTLNNSPKCSRRGLVSSVSAY